MDKHINIDFNWQIYVFEQQILLNKKINKPFIVHCVGAYNEIIQIYKKNKCSFPLIFHGFNKKKSVMEMLQKQGFYLSFGAALFHNLSCQASFICANKNYIFLETDSQTQFSIEEIYSQANFLLANQAKINIEAQISANFTNILSI